MSTVHTYAVETVKPEWNARVNFHQGRFAYVVRNGSDIVAANGADGELPTLDALVVDSHRWLDWHKSISILRQLRQLEISRYDVDSKRILERVFV